MSDKISALFKQVATDKMTVESITFDNLGVLRLNQMKKDDPNLDKVTFDSGNEAIIVESQPSGDLRVVKNLTRKEYYPYDAICGFSLIEDGSNPTS